VREEDSLAERRATSRAVVWVEAAADWHIYQVLTKRPARAAKLWSRHRHDLGLRRIPGHVWIGTSIENLDVAYRARHLRMVDAEIRFLSCEPLLGPLGELDLRGIHWVIGGGESGAHARPVHPSWALGLVAGRRVAWLRRTECLGKSRRHIPSKS
jgi:protein gp37